MGFGTKFKQYPTPASITLKTKIFIRLMSFFTIMLQFVPMPDVWNHILSALFVFLIGSANDVQDFFGVQVGKYVKGDDVTGIEDNSSSIKKD